MPERTYAQLNAKWFDGRCPGDTVITWAELGGATPLIDTRCHLASVYHPGDGPETSGWTIQLSTILKHAPELVGMVMAHEMVHILAGMRHGSKAWNREVRLLTAKGFFLRTF